MRIKNLPSIESMNGSQDALVIEQTDGSEDKSRKVSPAQIKQYVLGNSIDDVYSVMGQNGAKNLIPYPYYRASGHSSNGMTVTYDNDGVMTINKVAGSSTAFFALTYTTDNYCLKPNTKYKLLVEFDNTTQLSVFAKYGDIDIAIINKKSTGKYAVNFTTPQTLEGRENIAIYATASDTETNAKVKVMIMLASDTDNTYQPYAKTNRQLTEVIGDLSQTGLTGDSVAEQLGDASGQIGSLKTPTLIWEGSATVVDNTYNMTGNYTDYKYLLVVAKTNVEEKNILIPTSRISATTIFSDVLSAGAWNTTTNAFTYNSVYGIKFTAANKFQLDSLSYNNANWVLRPRAIYGIG